MAGEDEDRERHPEEGTSRTKGVCVFLYVDLFHVTLVQAALEKAQAELAADRQAFTEKSRKLDAIMKQVQGLQDP